MGQRLRWRDTAMFPDASGMLRAVRATYKFYTQGTGTTDNATTSGTPVTFALYDGLTGGSPIGTTKVADGNGQVVVYANAATRFDVGIEYGGVAVLLEDEGFDLDPSEVERHHVEHNKFGYTLVPGDASAATANTAALIALYKAVAEAGGGNLEFGSGYYLGPNINLAHALSYGVTVNLIGLDSIGGSVLYLTGTAGPWFDFGNGLSGGTNARWMMRGFLILHASTVASGATIRLRSGNLFPVIEEVEVGSGGSPVIPGGIGAGTGALIALETVVGVKLRHCLLGLKTSGDAPIGILVNNSIVMGGLILEETSVNAADGYRGTGISFENTALVDTVLIDRLSGITGCKYGIRKTLGEGTVQNLWFDGTIDGNGGAGYCFYLVPPTGAGCGTWLLDGAWLSGANVSGHVYLSTSGGGTITSFVMTGGYLTDAALDSIYIDGATLVRIMGITGGASGASVAGIRVQSGLNITLLDNTLNMSPNAQASIYVTANADPVTVDNNTSRVKDIIFLGKRSASRKLGNGNVYGGDSLLTLPSPASTSLDTARQTLIGNIHVLLSDVRLLWAPTWADTSAVITSETNGGGILTWDATVVDRLSRVGDADVPFQTFSGSNQFGYVADAAGFSFGDGATDSAVTFWFFGSITNTAAVRTLLSKYNTSNREWWLQVTAADLLLLALYDESANATVTRTSDAAISMDAPHLYTITYSGVGGASAGSGIAMYKDASLIASTAAAPTGTYTAMENLGARVEIGSRSVGANDYMVGSAGLVMISAGVATTRQMFIVKSWLNAYTGLTL